MRLEAPAVSSEIAPKVASLSWLSTPKAMPVILRNEAEFEGRLTTPADLALALHRPLPDDELMIVATGEREDKAA